MRFTAVQRITCIGNVRGMAIWNSRLLPAFSTRFQCKFDKYKNAGDSAILAPTLEDLKC